MLKNCRRGKEVIRTETKIKAAKEVATTNAIILTTTTSVRELLSPRTTIRVVVVAVTTSQ